MKIKTKTLTYIRLFIFIEILQAKWTDFQISWKHNINWFENAIYHNKYLYLIYTQILYIIQNYKAKMNVNPHKYNA